MELLASSKPAVGYTSLTDTAVPYTTKIQILESSLVARPVNLLVTTYQGRRDEVERAPRLVKCLSPKFPL